MKISKILVLAVAMASLAFAEINLNTATKKELMMLPGIGESKAEAIIEYRKANKFEKIEDIKNVKGIGNKRFEMLKADLAVSGDTDTTNLKSVAEKEKAKASKKAEKKVEKAKKDTAKKADKMTEKVKSEASETKEAKKVKETKESVKNAKENTKKVKAETKEAKENAKKVK